MELDKIRNDLTFLSNYEIILFGSSVDDTMDPKSDVDIAIITRIHRNQEEKLKFIYKSVIGQANPIYEFHVFELLPLYIQINIINQYLVLFGDPLEISEHFYSFRKLWAICEHRVIENQFNSVKEHLDYIAKQSRK